MTNLAPTARIPHDCEPPRARPDGQRPAAPRRDTRLVGVDVARGLALIGMAVVHLLPPTTAGGAMSLPWQLSAGKSAALFAVVAGVGIAFSTGRRQRPQGRRWVADGAALVVRALLIGALGLLLGTVVPFESAEVILAYYAALFLLAVPLLRLPVRWLLGLAAVTAVAVPVLSHLVRPGLGEPAGINPTLADLLSRPGQLAADLALTGTYPVLPWLAYLAVGMAVGRSQLSRKAVVVMVVAGTALASAASLASWYLLERAGGLEQLAEVAMRTMPLDSFTGLLVWGADGTLPTTTAWWLALDAPHTTTPLDLLLTIGTSVAVLGGCIALGWVAGPALRPLAAVGSMPLSLYTAHLLLLIAPFMPADPTAAFAAHLLVLGTFAMVWSRHFSRGPLEQAVSWVTEPIRRAVRGGQRVHDRPAV